MDPNAVQLGPGVLQPTSEMNLGRTVGNHTLEAFDLVDDCPAANLNSTMPVRVHTMRSYLISVTRCRWTGRKVISASPSPFGASSMAMNTSACSAQCGSPEWSSVSAGRSQTTQVLRWIGAFRAMYT